MVLKIHAVTLVVLLALPAYGQQLNVEVCGQYNSEKDYKEQAVIQVLEQYGAKAVSGYERNMNQGEVNTTIDISSTLTISSIKHTASHETPNDGCRVFIVKY